MDDEQPTIALVGLVASVRTRNIEIHPQKIFLEGLILFENSLLHN